MKQPKKNGVSFGNKTTGNIGFCNIGAETIPISIGSLLGCGSGRSFSIGLFVLIVIISFSIGQRFQAEDFQIPQHRKALSLAVRLKQHSTTLKTNLNFEDKDTKEMLSKFEFDFFLKQNIEEEKYNQADIDILYSSYKTTLKDLKLKYKRDKKQANYFLEGQVRKMFTGGFLPALFHLDEGRKHTMFGFQEIGHDLAYFKLWQDYYKRKVTAKKVWDVVVKVGSVLAIVLSIIKLWETFLRK